MQLYAPTTLAPARDFWLLRYTSVLDDGSLVVCICEEKEFSFQWITLSIYLLCTFHSITNIHVHKLVRMCTRVSFYLLNSSNLYCVLMLRSVRDLLKTLKMVQPCLRCSILLEQKCCQVDTWYGLVKEVVQSYTLLIIWIWRWLADLAWKMNNLLL